MLLFHLHIQKGASRAVVEQLTLANEWQVLHKFVKDPLRSVEGRQGLLGDKFRLASLIANSVYEVYWFHKSINPHIVLFFKSQDGGIDFSPPFHRIRRFSARWEGEDSEPPETGYLYRHPDYHTPEDRGDVDGTSWLKCRCEYDIYAFTTTYDSKKFSGFALL
jgi:hypothetical protein